MARTKPAPVIEAKPRRRTMPSLPQKMDAPARRRVPPTPKTPTGGKPAGTPRRGTKVLTKFTEFFHNWGGCLPFVDPEECSHQRLFRNKQKDGVVYWIDNGICKQFCPNGARHCTRYNNYWAKNGDKAVHEEFMKQRFIEAGASNGDS